MGVSGLKQRVRWRHTARQFWRVLGLAGRGSGGVEAAQAELVQGERDDAWYLVS
jgi:hypothetical protein